MLSSKMTELLVSEGTRQDLGITKMALTCTVHQTELSTPRSGREQFKDLFVSPLLQPLDKSTEVLISISDWCTLSRLMLDLFDRPSKVEVICRPTIQLVS